MENQNELKTPWDAFLEFLQDVSFAEVTWVITVLALMYAFHWLSTRQFTNNKHTWEVALLWYAGIFAWAVLFYLFGWSRVVAGGNIAVYIGLIFLVLSVISTSLLSYNNKLIKIINGVIKLIILFSIIATIGKKSEDNSWGYAIVFGATAGLAIGMSIISTIRTLAAPKAVVEDKFEDKKEGIDWGDSEGI